MEEVRHYINHDIKIDFKVPRDLQYIMDECERLDVEGSPAYYNYAETLDYGCKEAYATGRFTKKQWDLIMERYRY